MKERMTSEGRSVMETSSKSCLTELGDKMSLSEDSEIIIIGQNELGRPP